MSAVAFQAPHTPIQDIDNKKSIMDLEINLDDILNIYNEYCDDCEQRKVAKSNKDLVKLICFELKISENNVLSQLDYLDIHISDISSHVKFDVSPQYNTRHLDSNYNPERYHMIVAMENSINNLISEFVELNPKFSHLREISLYSVKEGNRIKNSENKIFEIIKRIGDDFEVRDIDNIVSVLKFMDARPLLDGITRYTIDGISEFYSFIKDHLDSRFYNDIEYFDIFTEYFKLDAAEFYKILSTEIKTKLLTKLNETTFIFKKRNVE